jgi:hypothetical protein
MLALLLACTGGEPDAVERPTSVEGCLTSFDIDEGWSYEDDIEWNRTSPYQIEEAYCSLDERACDPDAIISRRAAQCIARVEGLTDGITVDYDLHYNGWHETLLWRVEAHTWGDPTGDWGGVYMLIDAWDGVNVEQDSWEASQGDCL